MSSFKVFLFSRKSLLCAALFLAVGAGAAAAQDIAPGSSVMEAKSRKPETKSKSSPKNTSNANNRPATRSGKTGTAARGKINAAPNAGNAKNRQKESSDEEASAPLKLEVVVAAAPIYPGAAKQAGAAGNVRVDVVVDDQGDVISAQAVDGHELLRSSAEKAALSTKFAPRKLNGKAVKSSGYLIYCFGGGCD